MKKLFDFFKGKKVLVTGGSGFIGTNLVERLQEIEGVQVLNFDIAAPRNHAHSKYYKCVDITDYISLKKSFDIFSPSIVIHLAARTDLQGKSIEDYTANTVGVENLCRLISESECVEKACFASSMLVCKVGYCPSSDIEFSPTTIYGESKVISEKIIRSFDSTLPNYNIVRPTSIWGPWFKEPYSDFFKMVISRRYIDIGEKSCSKTYGYVTNAVHQILEACMTSSKGSLSYLGDEQPINISHWANLINGKVGNSKLITIPFIFFQSGAIVGDLLEKIGVKFPLTSFRLNNMTTDNVIPEVKLAKLNYFRATPLEVGVEETLKWLSENTQRKD
ncbi:NAD(P)-dependent oxidoreductase [Vibrio sp. 1262-1]|uniref:NAD-dependent epimerase/dehydratase family protein n=1 Tax=Vibrio sp. 1262-1 TaxID=3074548 RepID=UPI00296572B9|nr:NAD(P)-dependent oxidoreductase [Vibrio sp. 1262-1]MDW2402516.1 NAD(P)-dependent oxidoreductase [Vibrio sp. 1262-1]